MTAELDDNGLPATDIRRMERTLLKDNTADLLRDYITSGQVGSGSRLVERQVSAALGVSRMPIRDAMIRLEQEGLVANRPGGRYVIELSPAEALQLNKVRTVLEVLAVELAVESIGLDEADGLELALRRMARACAARQRADFIRADLEIHSAIWQAAKNEYLQKTLQTILGPLQVVIANSTETFEWSETLAIHEDLVTSIIARDRPRALAAITRHMESISR